MTADTLWLTATSSLRDHSVSHVLLYPAIELRALALVPQRNRDELDPFERAVLGACRVGVISVKEQAEVLGLHPDFVGHLQARLQDKTLIDSRGIAKTGSPNEGEREQSVLFLYWDQFVGRLWPRFTSSRTRRSVPLRHEGTKRFVEAGDDGDPFEIAAFEVPGTDQMPADLAVEDCLDAVHSWSRDLRRLKRTDESVLRPSLALMEDRRDVWLCVPVHHQRDRAVVQDPFGGAQWPHMLRTLADLSETNAGLRTWLKADSPGSAEGTAAPSGGDTESLLRELEVLSVRAQGPGEAQTRLDLIDLGHRLVDELERLGNRDSDPVAISATGYRSKAATMFGFELGLREPTASLPQTTSADDDLGARVRRLLDRFQPAIRGALHDVADDCPGLLELVSNPDRMAATTGLLSVCQALASGLPNSNRSAELVTATDYQD